jgi:hypothetical protein
LSSRRRLATTQRAPSGEAKVLGRIGRHANIVSLYDYDIDEDGTVE